MASYATAEEVINSFESCFADKVEIPETLEYMWLKKAVARFSNEIAHIEFDEETGNIQSCSCCICIDQYVIDTIANYMWQMYQEREVSKVNKRVSIIGKDLSWNTANNPNKYSAEELAYIANKSSEMTEHQKPPAYN